MFTMLLSMISSARARTFKAISLVRFENVVRLVYSLMTSSKGSYVFLSYTVMKTEILSLSRSGLGISR
jgi:hypothetical protein